MAASYSSRRRAPRPPAAWPPRHRGKAATRRGPLKKRLGCDACKTPAQNELGLRMLLGAAARAASRMAPCSGRWFSHYAAHGPVFRVAAVVDRSGADADSKAEQFLVCCRSCRVFACGQLPRFRGPS